MKTPEDFYALITPRVPSCPYPLIDEAVRDAVREFTTRTKKWRSTDCFTASSLPDNLMTAPTDTSIVQIEALRHNGKTLEPVSIFELNRMYSDWKTEVGSPKYYTQEDMDTVRIVPHEEGEIEIDLILKPAEGVDVFPDFIYNYHRSAIVDGALAYIHMIPSQEFTDPQMAMMYYNKFSQVLDRLMADQIIGQQKAPLRTKPHFF